MGFPLPRDNHQVNCTKRKKLEIDFALITIAHTHEPNRRNRHSMHFSTPGASSSSSRGKASVKLQLRKAVVVFQFLLCCCSSSLRFLTAAAPLTDLEAPSFEGKQSSLRLNEQKKLSLSFLIGRVSLALIGEGRARRTMAKRGNDGNKGPGNCFSDCHRVLLRLSSIPAPIYLVLLRLLALAYVSKSDA